MRTSILLSALSLLASSALTPRIAAQEIPPTGGTPKDFNLPQAQSFALDNGLQVTLVPYGATPKVFVQLVVRTGNIDEGPDEVWLADLTGDLMQEGTSIRSAAELARHAAAMGGELNIGVGLDQSSVGGDVLSEFGPNLVELIADVVRNPAFPEEELDRLKTDRIRQVSVSLQQPNSITLAEFRRRMYPDHAYGRIFPTPEMIQGYTVEQIRDFWSANSGAARSHLYASGQFDAAAMERAIRDAFGDWTSGSPAPERLAAPRTRREIVLIDRPEAPQSTIYLGIPTIDPSHADFVALQVTNTLLGGSFASRITSNIREDKGYTYSPNSSVSTRYRDAYWVQVASVGTAVTGAALVEIFREIDLLRAEPPTAEELEGIQNYAAGIFVLQNSSRTGIVGQLSFLNLHGLPDEYLTEYVSRIYAVTPDEVRRIAAEYLRPDEMLLVVAGDRSQVAGQLTQFGRVLVAGQ
jgi:predicted Zn-dependent peptidase